MTYSINVRERILRLPMLCQDSWGNLVHLTDKLEHWIIGQVTKSKFALRDVAGVGLAEDSVAIARNDLSGFESGPEIVRDGLVAEIVTDLLLHLLQPVEDFLVGSANVISSVVL